MTSYGAFNQNQMNQIRTAAANAPLQFEQQLKSMGFDFGQIKTLISSVNSDIMCGPECQKQKKLNELKDAMDAAKKVQDDAPYNLEQATKNYYSYKDGEVGYINHQRQAYTKAAKDEVEQMKADFTGQSQTVNQQIERSAALEVYIQNMNDLLNQYITKNQRLTKDIDHIRSTLQTSDRKAFYLSQKWYWETYIGWLCKAVYWLMTVIFIAYFVVYQGNFRNKYLIAYSALLIAIPFLLEKALTFEVSQTSLQSILDRIVGLRK